MIIILNLCLIFIPRNGMLEIMYVIYKSGVNRTLNWVCSGLEKFKKKMNLVF